MGERRFKTQDEANLFARMMRGISGLEMDVAQDGAAWVVKMAARSWSMVELTEELLRQNAK
ncbi:hypothetical protein E4K72_22510 [Oxalobacteraceae bacterium OM1]|nr:hypothetical protein E4K72_22510 [Oxalobacteraceae bacterium OM1]